MRDFPSLSEWAAHLERVVERHEATAARVLTVSAKAVVLRSKEKIGHYQPQEGIVPAWSPLAESTLAEKRRLGFTGRRSADDPLLRTGELMESYGFGLALWSASSTLQGWQAHIGSPLDVALWQELGTAKMPPRPVISGATAEEASLFAAAVGAAFFGLWKV